MQKIILVTGSTDGIGYETAKMLLSLGHCVLIHGRSQKKLEQAEKALTAKQHRGVIETYLADLSRLADVESLAKAVSEKHNKLDVLINNAGIFNTSEPTTQDGLDVRFVVNTIAPFHLTKCLLPLMSPSGRVINVSSAAQSPVDLKALFGQVQLSDRMAYAQSKLALNMWTRDMADSLGKNGPAIIAVNPKSLLGSKMVKQAFGVAGADLGIGADILKRAALSDEFADASGRYFDNDIGEFAQPHADALVDQKCKEIVRAIEKNLTAMRT